MKGLTALHCKLLQLAGWVRSSGKDCVDGRNNVISGKQGWLAFRELVKKKWQTTHEEDRRTHRFNPN